VCGKYGLYTGNSFEEFIRGIVMSGFNRFHTQLGKEGNNDFSVKNGYTFKDLYDITGRELIVTASNVSNGNIEYYSVKTTPDMLIHKAIRRSCSFPFFFDTVLEKDKDKNNYYVDGGLLSNYPLEIFTSVEDVDVLMDHNENSHELFMKTLGFKIMNPDEQKQRELITLKNDIHNLMSYGMALAEVMLNRNQNLMIDYIDNVLIDTTAEDDCHINHSFWDITLTAVIDEVTTLNSNVTIEQKNSMCEKWYNVVLDHFVVIE
jgi:predicted acylesterase/phospholipase RssA